MARWITALEVGQGLVSAVHPCLADDGVFDGESVEQTGTGNQVLHACGGDQDRQEQAKGVGGDAGSWRVPSTQPIERESIAPSYNALGRFRTPRQDAVINLQLASASGDLHPQERCVTVRFLIRTRTEPQSLEGFGEEKIQEAIVRHDNPTLEDSGQGVEIGVGEFGGKSVRAALPTGIPWSP